MIKAIAFDLHGVLGTGTTKDLIKSISEKLSISPELAEKGIRNEKRIGTYLGEYSIQEYWQEFINVVGDRGFSIDELIQLHIDLFVPDEKMFDLLKELKDKYTLIMITNNIREKFHVLSEKYKFGDYFSMVIVSCYSKSRKPDPEVFQLACALTNCSPAEMLFVDDLKRNTDAAEEFGMKTILFEDYDKFLEQFKKLE